MCASDLLFLFFFLDMVSFNKKYCRTCTTDYTMLYITTFSVHKNCDVRSWILYFYSTLLRYKVYIISITHFKHLMSFNNIWLSQPGRAGVRSGLRLSQPSHKRSTEVLIFLLLSFGSSYVLDTLYQIHVLPVFSSSLFQQYLLQSMIF